MGVAPVGHMLLSGETGYSHGHSSRYSVSCNLLDVLTLDLGICFNQVSSGVLSAFNCFVVDCQIFY